MPVSDNRQSQTQGDVTQKGYPTSEVRYASWAMDVPRVWLLGKLLWDPEADIDVLMERLSCVFPSLGKIPMATGCRLCYGRKFRCHRKRR